MPLTCVHLPPQAYSAVAVKPSATGRLLKVGIAVLIAGALLLLLGAVGAFYFWNNDKHVRPARRPHTHTHEGGGQSQSQATHLLNTVTLKDTYLVLAL